MPRGGPGNGGGPRAPRGAPGNGGGPPRGLGIPRGPPRAPAMEDKKDGRAGLAPGNGGGLPPPPPRGRPIGIAAGGDPKLPPPPPTPPPPAPIPLVMVRIKASRVSPNFNISTHSSSVNCSPNCAMVRFKSCGDILPVLPLSIMSKASPNAGAHSCFFVCMFIAKLVKLICFAPGSPVNSRIIVSASSSVYCLLNCW